MPPESYRDREEDYGQSSSEESQSERGLSDEEERQQLQGPFPPQAATLLFGVIGALCLLLALLAVFLASGIISTSLPVAAPSASANTPASSLLSSLPLQALQVTQGTTSTPPTTSTSPASRATEVPRTAPPSTFDGTAAGFASLCSVHYTDPDPVKEMTWSGTSGSVTREEIETAIGLLSKITPLNTTNGQANALAHGNIGQGCYNGGLLYEVTGDRRVLDVVLQLAENILAIRNDPVTGVVLWTGNRDPVWPPGPFPPDNTSVLQPASSSNGNIVANMVIPALFILKSPCLWDLVPSKVNGWSGPTTFADTDTYKTRAFALVEAGELAYSEYFLPRFFDANKNIIQPDDQRWDLVGDGGGGNGPGRFMAFNRRVMILNGLIRLAAIHETAAAKDAALVAEYDSYIEVNIKAFVGALIETAALTGQDTYDWRYSLNTIKSMETFGLHGYYDVQGVFIAWQRNPSLFGTSEDLMQRFANTLMYNIYKGDSTFAGLIGGTSTEVSPEANRAWAGWTVFGKWVPEWYEAVADSNVKNLSLNRNECAIPLLWTKNAFVTNDWTGGFATGTDSIAGTA